VAALAGLDVVLEKGTSGGGDAALAQNAAALEHKVKKGKLTREAADAARAHLRVAADREALAGCALVIESIAEDLSAKQRLLAELDRILPKETVLASNTSSLSLTELAGGLAHPERFLGMHFFSPVPAMKLVELAATDRTHKEALERARQLAQRMGKTPVVLAETPGYIVNRLLVPYLLDALSALEARVATADEIDLAMKLGCGHPVGPLALADAIGLDVVYAMAKTLHHELADRRYSPPAILRRLVLNGQLGKKTRVGVYDYRTETVRENAELWPASAPDAAHTP
jgi:3-hydroxybutyryl-CoA dehydrogenase